MQKMKLVSAEGTNLAKMKGHSKIHGAKICTERMISERFVDFYDPCLNARFEVVREIRIPMENKE